MTSSGEFHWRATAAPRASRTDDISFLDADRGWAVNANGHVLHTTDGGDSWIRQFSAPGVYLRCVGFANERRGWVGTLSAARRLFTTRDGGTGWTLVENLPPQAPSAICGLSVVDEHVVYASGTNFPNRPTGIVKTVDGGETWTGIDMTDHASLLVDIFFRDEHHGWVVGGKADRPGPTRDNVTPVVLFTDDGGATWDNRLAGIDPPLPVGEWGWKIQFVTDEVGFVSLEDFNDGAVLKTTDGGQTWTRKEVNDPQGNANLEGVGFVDELHGWTGGWGDKNFTGGFTSETHDGGETWTDANQVGKFLNRFRFIRHPELVGFASGDTVYKYAAAPADAPLEAPAGRMAPLASTGLPVRLPVEPRAEAVRVDVWDRFGAHVATRQVPPGAAEVEWLGDTDSGAPAVPGIYVVRVAAGDEAESHVVRIEG